MGNTKKGSGIVSETGKYIILNPTQGPTGEEGVLAPRLSALEGTTVGFVNNGKRNSEVFLRSLLEQVQLRYNLKEVVWIDKENASKPLSDETLQRLKSCQLVVTGVGD
jgi:hypothetical protein